MANLLLFGWVLCPRRGVILLGIFGKGAKPGSTTRPDPMLNQKKSSSNTRFQTSPLKSTPNFRAGLCISTPYQSLSPKPLKSVQNSSKTVHAPWGVTYLYSFYKGISPGAWALNDGWNICDGQMLFNT